ncbi:MAG: methyltransferase domain-containing protein [Bacteroidota bacterium]
MKKQVNKTHYQFNKYLQKARWISIWHQIDEVIKSNPLNVLEIGPGPGLFKHVLNSNEISVETVDIDPELQPDHVASATQLPFEDNSYDCVCAFQMLEHLPYHDSLKAFNDFVRVSRKNIIISLPNAKKLWHYSFYIPKIGQFSFSIPKPRIKNQNHIFDGEHYWEINKKGFSLNKIKKDFITNDTKLTNSYRVIENPYHHFFIFEKYSKLQLKLNSNIIIF